MYIICILVGVNTVFRIVVHDGMAGIVLQRGKHNMCNFSTSPANAEVCVDKRPTRLKCMFAHSCKKRVHAAPSPPSPPTVLRPKEKIGALRPTFRNIACKFLTGLLMAIVGKWTFVTDNTNGYNTAPSAKNSVLCVRTRLAVGAVSTA